MTPSISWFPSRPAYARLTPPNAVVGPELVLVDSDAGQMWMPAADGVMRPYIASQGMWSPDENWFFRQFARPGLRFVDVGANVGYFSLLAAALCPDAHITAFEPHPVLVEVLRLNLWHNKVSAAVVPIALTAGERTVTLSSAPTNPGDTRALAANAGGHATTVVPSAQFDQVFPDAAVDLIKIDVQGYEADVLTGMVGALERNPKVTIVAEFWPTGIRERGSDPRAVLDLYRELGLSVTLLATNRLTPATPAEVMRFADSGGPDGQANLVLRPHRKRKPA